MKTTLQKPRDGGWHCGIPWFYPGRSTSYTAPTNDLGKVVGDGPSIRNPATVGAGAGRARRSPWLWVSARPKLGYCDLLRE